MLGYADDTRFLVSDHNSIVEWIHVLKEFELATGVRLNKNKTKLFGIGQWKGKTDWPINNVYIAKGFINILGISFMNDFDMAITMTTHAKENDN